jgi:hypothetical protein
MAVPARLTRNAASQRLTWGYSVLFLACGHAFAFLSVKASRSLASSIEMVCGAQSRSLRICRPLQLLQLSRPGTAITVHNFTVSDDAE